MVAAGYDDGAGPGEPVVTVWRVAGLGELAARLTGSPTDGGAAVVAVDGRGGSGKSTLAGRIAAAVPGAVVVPTDDVAWNHDFFDWADLLVDGVLRPFRAGREVAFTPPAWTAHGRPGSIRVAAQASLVIVEGCGSGRAGLAPWLDAAVWVQSDFTTARARALPRDVAQEGRTYAEAAAFWDEWMAVEIPFYLADRPWERADVLVGGSNQFPHDPTTEVLVAPVPR